MLNGSLPYAFSRVVLQHLNRIALAGDGELTYAQLDARSEAIAGWLRAREIGRDQRVGLYAQRSCAAIAAILGILKAGAAYVPFDPSYPRNLLRNIYEDSAPATMLVQASLLRDGHENDLFWKGETLRLEEVGDRPAIAAVAPRLDTSEVRADDPAYVMYTSGSTGRPKGVVVPHRAVLRLVLDNDYAEFGPDEVFLQLAPLSFDASTFEIWGALLHGGRLAILPNPCPTLQEIGRAISRLGVTTMWLTAGLFHLMVDNCLDSLAPVRQLLAGGDVLSPARVAKALQVLPNCRLINGYGPTENTTFSCCYTIPRDCDRSAPIPIGRPIRHTEAHILDENQRPVSDGETGELYVGGAGLAIGYLNRPELTAERFISNPYSTAGGARLYRTGDRVRRDPDGNLHFLGRSDRQVKINGKRVELDEIEMRLRGSGLIRDAAVISVATSTGHNQLASFVTALPGQSLSVDEVRRFLRSELPDYMVPTITIVDSLPLSPNGKVDRARLPLAMEPAAAARSGEPASAIEAKLLEIWRNVLGTGAIGLDDNFFDLGGTSLQLMEVHASIERIMPCGLTVVDMFQYPCISALARFLTAQEPGEPRALDVQARAHRQRTAIAQRRNLPRARPSS